MKKSTRFAFRCCAALVISIVRNGSLHANEWKNRASVFLLRRQIVGSHQNFVVQNLICSKEVYVLQQCSTELVCTNPPVQEIARLLKNPLSVHPVSILNCGLRQKLYFP